MNIPFNKPYLSGNELEYIHQAISSGKISGDGEFTKKCHRFFEERYHFQKTLLTTSCTDALEMCALLLDIQPGDEVIMPSYTFVSTANAFVLRGASLVFIDSRTDNPNMDENAIERAITARTKAIVVVHYAGIACDIDRIVSIAKKHRLAVVEDAAQAIDSFYKDKPLGSFGAVSAFSFHETKNIISGEGGMIVINDPVFNERAEIIREKGTNRSAFFRGEVDKYGWVDVGSSFLPSEITAAFLYAQIENLDRIQQKRISLWNLYRDHLISLENKGLIQLPCLPDYATNNAHMFYFVCRSLDERSRLIGALKQNGVLAVFHYQSLHRSPYFTKGRSIQELPQTDRYTDCLIRLPLFFELQEEMVEKICSTINAFYTKAD